MELQSPLTAGEIQAILKGALIGSPDVVIRDVAKIEDAGPHDITFIASPKYQKFAATTDAGCILVPKNFETPETITASLISVEQPYESFLQILRHFYPPREFEHGYRHSSANIDASAIVAPSAHIGPGVVIGKRCTIGENAVLLANVCLYDDVAVGADTVVNANVVCYDRTVIGAACILHSGAVIGSDGFGFLERSDGSYEKIPHVGKVLIHDHVEIGANTTIDRATMGNTIIEEGVKIDNLVHIAHNVTLGKDSAITAQVGIAGSAKIGRRNRFGGQVGLIGHIETADDVVIIAQSGVSKAITKKGRYLGSPAKEAMEAFKQEAALRNLPNMMHEFRKLQNDVETLRKNNERQS